MTPDRTPPGEGDPQGRALLLAALAAQRAHVLGILEGLDEADLRRAVLPSGWTPMALVHHLALDVERFWFQGTVGGCYARPDRTPPDGWAVPAGMSGAQVLQLYRHECAESDAVLATVPLDAPAVWWPELLRPLGPARALRGTLLHVVVETATHAGHLDAVRELVDGRRWLVLD